MKKRLAAAFVTLAALLAGAVPVLWAEETAVPMALNGSSLTPDPGGAALSDCVSDAEAFHTFLETWNLSGLIPAGISMTNENRYEVLNYFDALDETARNYIILLLQQLAAGQPTAADPYCDRESGVYLRACQYCLYDMDLDGSPEWILKTGVCEADFWYTVYTIVDGALVDCGGLSGSHAELYANGSGGFVRYTGQMGVYDITAAALEETALVTQEVGAGVLAPDKGEDYPALEEYGYGDYDQRLEFGGIPTLLIAPSG